MGATLTMSGLETLNSILALLILANYSLILMRYFDFFGCSYQNYFIAKDSVQTDYYIKTHNILRQKLGLDSSLGCLSNIAQKFCCPCSSIIPTHSLDIAAR
jgi:hypothetical protein